MEWGTQRKSSTCHISDYASHWLSCHWKTKKCLKIRCSLTYFLMLGHLSVQQIDSDAYGRCNPNSENIPSEFSPSNVRLQLQTIRDVRNVSAHIAQKIDQIIALNASVLGSINWVTLVSQEPLKIKTHFIRPGIMRRNTQCQFAMPNGEVSFIHGGGSRWRR